MLSKIYTPWLASAPVRVYDMIVQGDKDKRYISDVYKFNKVGHSWEPIGHIPSARSSSPSVNTADNRITGWKDKREDTDAVYS